MHRNSCVPDALQRETLLPRAGTQKITGTTLGHMGSGSAAHHCVLRCVRGTRS